MHGKENKKEDKNVFLIRNNATQILKAKFIHFGSDPQPTDTNGILNFNFN